MDVIVVGAGPVGMATAAFLGRQGLSVGLVEKNANHYNQRSVRWYAMGADTLEWLGNAGVSVTGHSIHTVTVTCAGSNEHVVFGPDRHKQPLSTVVGCAVLRTALQERIQNLDTVSYYQPCTIVSWERQRGVWSLGFSNGDTVRTPLVVGCDGRLSAVRAFFQPKTSTWDFGQKACVFHVHGLERGQAYEHFFPGGSLALLAIEDGPDSKDKGRGVGIWADTTHRCDDQDVYGRIQSAMTALVPGVRWVPDSGRWFPLMGQWVHNPFFDRCALVGDAACAIHPLAGQGLNIGMRMAKRMCDHVVQRYRTQCDWGQSLDTLFWPFYTIAGSMQAATYGLAQGLSLQAQPWIWTWGARIVNAVPALKDMIMGASGKIVSPSTPHDFYM